MTLRSPRALLALTCAVALLLAAARYVELAPHDGGTHLRVGTPRGYLGLTVRWARPCRHVLLWRGSGLRWRMVAAKVWP